MSYKYVVGVKLRLVSFGDTVLPEDNNSRVEALKRLKDRLKFRTGEIPSEIESFIESLRKVSNGDYVYASDILDAKKAVLDLIEYARSKGFKGIYLDLAEMYANMVEDVKSGDIIEPYHHNYLVYAMENLDLATKPIPPVELLETAKLKDKIIIVRSKSLLETPVLTDEIEVLPYLSEISGLNPYDPLWTPPEGWDKIVRFKEWSEAEEFFVCPLDPDRVTLYNAYVSNDQLGFDPPSGDSGTADRCCAEWIKRIAVCMKYKAIENESTYGWTIFELKSANGERRLRITLALKAGSLTRIEIIYWENTTGYLCTRFTNPEDWMVVMIDFDGIVRVWDKNKNLIAECYPSKYSTTELADEIHFEEHNEPTIDTTSEPIIDDLYIDWIAIRFGS